MKQYRILLNFGRIEAVDVDHETKNFVTLANGRKEKKETNWYAIRPTFAECKELAIQRARVELSNQQARLDRARSHLQNMQALKEAQP